MTSFLTAPKAHCNISNYKCKTKSEFKLGAKMITYKEMQPKKERNPFDHCVPLIQVHFVLDASFHFAIGEKSDSGPGARLSNV